MFLVAIVCFGVSALQVFGAGWSGWLVGAFVLILVVAMGVGLVVRWKAYLMALWLRLGRCAWSGGCGVGKCCAWEEESGVVGACFG